MTKNLTEGSILKNIVVFSLPYLLSYFLQTLYGMADLFLAGQFNGADVISAVSIGSQVMHMFTVIIVGLAMGGTVLIGQAVGAKDSKRTSKIIGNTVTFFLIFSAVVTVILLFACRGIVNLIQTPPESLEQTILYLRICFIGIPFIVAYNVIASIFRGMGDSKSPMIFVIIACTLNIILDYIFMGVLGMKAEGAAIATVIAQAVSVIISLIAIVRSKSLRLTKEDFKLQQEALGAILKIGVPVACQDGFIQISFMVITVIANRRGVDVAAAVGIVEKIICFLFLIPSSMLSSISAIAAQNIGAGYHDRARHTLYAGTAIAVGIGAVFAVAFQFISYPVIKLFTREEIVVVLGTQYLKSYVTDCVLAAIHFCFSGYFCAMGKSIISFIHNVISIIAIRIPGAWLASKLWPETLFPMGCAAPLGSLLSALICVGAFLWLRKKKPA
ncbi:putative efflux protein, MATE family [Treponema bryantii]|uniref:Putative efflux protein, MATE family n=1 Tax=Treponema bryantii TaxID=163 RepID=A0A1I3I0V8_9SPIR|nr:MATE family efflux transporter [Treponema bryantii]SFI41490.1 putative efflux protein, MATE family [Treponema bryantii]